MTCELVEMPLKVYLQLVFALIVSVLSLDLALFGLIYAFPGVLVGIECERIAGVSAIGGEEMAGSDRLLRNWPHFKKPASLFSALPRDEGA